MVRTIHEFKVLADELDYLILLASRDASFANLLRTNNASHSHTTSIWLSRVEAEQLRDYLTTQLAAAGFDHTYSPNEQRRVLENLIDKLYVG